MCGCWVTQSCPTLCDPVDYSLPGSSVHGGPPGKNTGVDCQALLQGIFPTQGQNPGLPHYRQILYHLSHKGSPDITGSYSSWTRGPVRAWNCTSHNTVHKPKPPQLLSGESLTCLGTWDSWGNAHQSDAVQRYKARLILHKDMGTTFADHLLGARHHAGYSTSAPHENPPRCLPLSYFTVHAGANAP